MTRWTDPPSRRQARPIRTPLAVIAVVLVEFAALAGAILAVWLFVLLGFAPFLAP